MTDFFELDFLGVETKKSGDAIGIRYSVGGRAYIHLVDGGYKETGQKILRHFDTYYGSSSQIDHLVTTHNDGDHTGGLCEVIESGRVKKAWLLCPWHYADELMDRFPTYNSVERLRSHLKAQYSNLAAVEETAHRYGVPIAAPFQNAEIGAFRVMAPSRSRYLNLVVNSDKTPQAGYQQNLGNRVRNGLLDAASAVAYAPILRDRAAWGVEIFSSAQVSEENKMSVIQYANICGQKILLTGDAEESALTEAADYAPLVGLQLPGVDRFQVPHHGSRRRVTSQIFDRWLGPILGQESRFQPPKFTALVSSAKEDKDHPRNAVVRAMIHRGGVVYETEGEDVRSSLNAPPRPWGPAIASDYPMTQEEE
jgi:hypothetical protein